MNAHLMISKVKYTENRVVVDVTGSLDLKFHVNLFVSFAGVTYSVITF